jgi:hypothetical protein
MISNQRLKIFDSFDMQFGRSEIDRGHIQETIDYCEFRFRTILGFFSRSSDGRQMVLQRYLHNELVGDLFSDTSIYSLSSSGFRTLLHWDGNGMRRKHKHTNHYPVSF